MSSIKNFPWWTLTSNKDPVETLIFIDFETTGLFSYENVENLLIKRWVAGDQNRKPEQLLYNFHTLSNIF